MLLRSTRPRWERLIVKRDFVEILHSKREKCLHKSHYSLSEPYDRYSPHHS